MERVPITNEVAQSEPAADACWNALRLLRARIRVVPAGFRQCVLRIGADPLVAFDAQSDPMFVRSHQLYRTMHSRSVALIHGSR